MYMQGPHSPQCMVCILANKNLQSKWMWLKLFILWNPSSITWTETSSPRNKRHEIKKFHPKHVCNELNQAITLHVFLAFHFSFLAIKNKISTILSTSAYKNFSAFKQTFLIGKVMGKHAARCQIKIRHLIL